MDETSVKPRSRETPTFSPLTGLYVAGFSGSRSSVRRAERKALPFVAKLDLGWRMLRAFFDATATSSAYRLSPSFQPSTLTAEQI
jgi:hypothetical protein